MKNQKSEEEGYYFGVAKIGEKGQIVIPKEARDLFQLKSGDTVVLVGDSSKGLYITKSSMMKEFALNTLSSVGILKNKTSKKK
ncbi:MAG: AbrB/MazE/SpoVT family DNA-binding domain-containing protein [Candidatus Paceibacterota bacterium]|jgi:AbrB family looped-hinge helix DNA binding protein